MNKCLISRSLAALLISATSLSCTTSATKSAQESQRRTTASHSEGAALCSQDSVSALYQSLTAATCQVNYAWELLGHAPSDDTMLNCAAFYMGTGGVLAAAGGLAQTRLQAWSKNMTGERTSLVRNTPINRKDAGILMANPIFSTLDDVDARDGELIRFQAIQRLYERWGNLKNDFAQSANRGSDRIEKILAKYPQNYIRYHYLGDAGRLNGSTLAVTKGPNYHALQSSKLAFRLGLLSTGVGMVMIATDTILGSTATACSEHVQSYYDADRDNNCKATPVAGPNVLKFLQLEETEQAALLQSYPTLCPIYQKIADTQDFENRQKFGTNEITHSCQDGKALIQLGHDNGLKTEIQLVDLNARMKSHGETIDVTYRKNGEGRVTIAGITWRSSYGGSKPIRYNFPADLEKAGDPRFQNIFQQVAKNTFALESADIFNLDCR